MLLRTQIKVLHLVGESGCEIPMIVSSDIVSVGELELARRLKLFSVALNHGGRRRQKCVTWPSS